MFRVTSNDTRYYFLSSEKPTLDKLKKYIIYRSCNTTTYRNVGGSGSYEINNFISGINGLKISYDKKAFYPSKSFYKDIILSLSIMKEIVTFYDIRFAGELSNILSEEKYLNYNYIIVPKLITDTHGYKRWTYSSEKIKEITKLLRDKGLKRTNFKSNNGIFYISEKSVYVKMKMILDNSHLFIDLDSLKSAIDY